MSRPPTGLLGALLLGLGNDFAVFALAQVLLGASAAFASGTDSALLYESLSETGRADEVERQELRAWRFSIVALAMSAVLGGGMALWGGALPFLASAAAFAGVLLVSFGFREPSHARSDLPQGAELARLGTLRAALTEPVLVWLFAVSVLMYIFSHILFVFGQPFILEALKDTGVQEDAPLVSGTVSALMMLLSVAASLAAPTLRRKLGLPMILMIAFAIQIALSGTLALSTSMLVIAVLILRIVPDALSWPFIVARVQPMLSSESRATYLSLQSFAGRLIFAATLYLAALATSGQGQMVHSEIRQVLGWYVGAGLFCLAALAVAATRLSIESDDKPT